MAGKISQGRKPSKRYKRILFFKIFFLNFKILVSQMKIDSVISFLELLAHPQLQEHYDNAGLITGNQDWECTGIICALDATEEVIHEAVLNHGNLVVAHHPIIFNGLKKINGNNYVEKTI